MTNATRGLRSNSPQDMTTVQPSRQTSQAATRAAAYVDSVLATWPDFTPQQQKTIGSLLGTGTGMSVAAYQHWEIEHWILENETPGRFGTFAAGEAT